MTVADFLPDNIASCTLDRPHYNQTGQETILVLAQFNVGGPPKADAATNANPVRVILGSNESSKEWTLMMRSGVNTGDHSQQMHYVVAKIHIQGINTCLCL